MHKTQGSEFGATFVVLTNPYWLLSRTRPQKGRRTDWQHPHDPDARITKMKDGRTRLAHKAEHAVDLEARDGTACDTLSILSLDVCKT